MLCWIRNVSDNIRWIGLRVYKDHKIRTYEIKKISLSCFDDKMYIQNNGYDGLALWFQS